VVGGPFTPRPHFRYAIAYGEPWGELPMLAALAGALAIALSGADPVPAPPTINELWCSGGDGVSLDQRIAACTARIQSSDTTDKIAFAYYHRGVAYESKGDHDRAIADLDQAIRLKPDFAEAYLARGVLYGARKRDYDRALADLDEAIRLKPDFAVAYYARGVVYVEGKGDDDRAIADWDQAIRLNPGYADAYTARGVMYARKGDYDRAIADYNEVIRLRPGSAAAYYGRGFAYENKADHDRSLADFHEAILFKPDYAEAYFARGIIYGSIKHDHERAMANFDEAIRLKPDLAAARNGACWSRAILGRDLDRALHECDEALKLKPVEAEFLDSRAFVLFRLGRYDQAIADATAALEKNPKIAGSLYVRGLAKIAKGDEAGGSADIEAAKAIKPGIAEEYGEYLKPRPKETRSNASSPLYEDFKMFCVAGAKGPDATARIAERAGAPTIRPLDPSDPNSTLIRQGVWKHSRDSHTIQISAGEYEIKDPSSTQGLQQCSVEDLDDQDNTLVLIQNSLGVLPTDRKEYDVSYVHFYYQVTFVNGTPSLIIDESQAKKLRSRHELYGIEVDIRGDFTSVNLQRYWVDQAPSDANN
jgi:tetratricopeptide (TPR) repeat protein